jgi:hypothetical protein
MAITSIRAHFECDGCGDRFWLEIDAAGETSDHTPSIADLAEDTLRGGNPSDGECGSVQHDLHLCHDCTKKADAIGDEDTQPTRQQILEATGAL